VVVRREEWHVVIALKALGVLLLVLLSFALLLLGFATVGVGPALLVYLVALVIVGVWLNRRLRGTKWTTPLYKQL
jgi:hypothetical protein